MQTAEALECDDRLPTDVSLRDQALELERLAPFGVGNREPLFLCTDLEISGDPVVINDSHLKMIVQTPDGSIEAIAWRRAQVAPYLSELRRIDAVASLQMRRWRGRNQPQLIVQDLRPSGV